MTWNDKYLTATHLVVVAKTGLPNSNYAKDSVLQFPTYDLKLLINHEQHSLDYCGKPRDLKVTAVQLVTVYFLQVSILLDYNLIDRKWISTCRKVSLWLNTCKNIF